MKQMKHLTVDVTKLGPVSAQVLVITGNGDEPVRSVLPVAYGPDDEELKGHKEELVGKHLKATGQIF